VWDYLFSTEGDDLAEQIVVSPSRVSRLADEFLTRGWLERAASHQDGRLSLVRLTDTGRTTLPRWSRRSPARCGRTSSTHSARGNWTRSSRSAAHSARPTAESSTQDGLAGDRRLNGRRRDDRLHSAHLGRFSGPHQVGGQPFRREIGPRDVSACRLRLEVRQRPRSGARSSRRLRQPADSRIGGGVAEYDEASHPRPGTP
jgi:DNA-binding MarR family transcriptional regulator